ncbi:uncharacterized protein FRV6_02532 [Fusarium oxysporum]|uniref:WSC domain-containing protein n=1 Tax=Fusarium oxysporum TaxID=5507 RepID=A0A2H3ST19_FUSOX|nr:uncharacterized protein FRV6_02532 [Fusarium oxysporum]
MRLSSGLLVACASGAFAHNFKRFTNSSTSAFEPSTTLPTSLDTTTAAAPSSTTAPGDSQSVDLGSATLGRGSSFVTGPNGETIVRMSAGANGIAQFSASPGITKFAVGAEIQIRFSIKVSAVIEGRKRAFEGCTLDVNLDGETIYSEPLADTNGAAVEQASNPTTLNSEKPNIQFLQSCGSEPVQLDVSDLAVAAATDGGSTGLPTGAATETATETGTEVATGTNSEGATTNSEGETVIPTGTETGSAIATGTNSEGATTNSEGETVIPTETAIETNSAGFTTNSEGETVFPTGTQTGAATNSEGATTNSEGETVIPTATGTEASASASATSPAGFPGSVGVFTLFGCVGSSAGFPTFELAETNAQMDLERCASLCTGRAYFGVYDTACYCGDEVDADNTSRVDIDQCDIQCPGDRDNFCGGDTRRNRLQARQAVAAGRLLTVYVSAIGAGATVTDSVTETVTDQTTLVTTYTTAVAGPQTTTTETVTAVQVCFNGKCYTQTSDRTVFIFIEVNGSDCDNEWVFITEECSCQGGLQYVPKFCSGGSCAGEKVYKTQECHDWWNHETFYVAADCEVCKKGEVMYKPWENAWGTPDNCKAEMVPVCNGAKCPAVKVPTHGYTHPVYNGTYTNTTSHGGAPHCSGPNCPGSKVVPHCSGPNCPGAQATGSQGSGSSCNGADCHGATGSGPKPTTVPVVINGAGKQAVGAATLFAALFAALL